MTWLERILATPCPAGHDRATPGHWCVTGKQEGFVCTSRIAAAEGAVADDGPQCTGHLSHDEFTLCTVHDAYPGRKSGPPEHAPAVCRHPSWADNGICHTCGQHTGKKLRP